MYCKCNRLMESITTHVVNHKDHLIIVKMFPVKNASNAAQNIILMKQHAN